MIDFNFGTVEFIQDNHRL